MSDAQTCGEMRMCLGASNHLRRSCASDVHMCREMRIYRATLCADRVCRTPKCVVKCELARSGQPSAEIVCVSDAQTCGEMRILCATALQHRPCGNDI